MPSPLFSQMMELQAWVTLTSKVCVCVCVCVSIVWKMFLSLLTPFFKCPVFYNSILLPVAAIPIFKKKIMELGPLRWLSVYKYVCCQAWWPELSWCKENWLLQVFLPSIDTPVHMPTHTQKEYKFKTLENLGYDHLMKLMGPYLCSTTNIESN